MESDYFKKAIRKYKYKLNVGIAIRKRKKQPWVNWSRQVVRNSQGVAYKGTNDPNGNWTKQSNKQLRACLQGGGGPQIGEVTYGGSPHLSCKRDQIKMRDYVNRRVTSPIWGPPPPCKQALKDIYLLLQHLSLLHSTLYLLPDLNQLFDMKFRWYLLLLLIKTVVSTTTKYKL